MKFVDLLVGRVCKSGFASFNEHGIIAQTDDGRLICVHHQSHKHGFTKIFNATTAEDLTHTAALSDKERLLRGHAGIHDWFEVLPQSTSKGGTVYKQV